MWRPSLSTIITIIFILFVLIFALSDYIMPGVAAGDVKAVFVGEKVRIDVYYDLRDVYNVNTSSIYLFLVLECVDGHRVLVWRKNIESEDEALGVASVTLRPPPNPSHLVLAYRKTPQIGPIQEEKLLTRVKLQHPSHS